MRSGKRTVGYGKVKSRSAVDILLTIEEANALVECDPEVIARLDTFLTHMGARKKSEETEK